MEAYKDHIDQQLFEEIEAYLLNSMNPADKASFEERIASDPQLQNEIRLQQQLMALAQVASYQPQSKTHSAPAAPIRTISRWWWAAAAFVLIASGIWIFQSPTSPQRLANNFFQPDPGLPVTMSSSTQYQFYDGMVSYKEGDYKKAISTWQSLRQSNQNSDTLQYFLAMAELNQQQYNNALNLLLPLAQSPGEWKEKASWFLAITYLQLGQPQNAQPWLQAIPQYPPANELLPAVNKLIRSASR